MAVRVTYIAIAVGGACGTVAALVGTPQAPAPAPERPLPLRPIAAQPRPASSTRAVATVLETQARAPLPSPGAGGVPPSSVALAGSTVASATPVPAPAPLSSAETAPPPTTKDALLRAEMHCDQRDAAACILAARAYEAGSAGASDPEKAQKYRRIALTHWISQCDHNSAGACAILADMYRAGRGVPQSDRNADALIARARELCHYNDAPACHELPPAP